MVSFSCENCGDVLTKKKLDGHRNSCRGCEFTCLDCMEHFKGTEYRSHTSCISEAQKYQGKLFKPTKKSTTSAPQLAKDESDSSTALVRAKVPESAHKQASAVAIVDAPPRAPSPPPAPVNVFDFLIQDGGDDEWESDEDDMRPEYPANPAFVHPLQSAKERLNARMNGNANGHANDAYETPDPRRSHARTTSIDSNGQKKSAKRKRGHVEDIDTGKAQNGDVVMTEAPASLHSGLTGGINKLMSQRNGLPPSPDESPNSPIKRSRRDEQGNSSKDKSRRKNSDGSDKADRKKAKHDKKEPSTATKAFRLLATAKKRSTASSSAVGTATKGESPTSTPQNKKPALKAIEYPTEATPDDSMALVKISHAPTTRPVASFLDCLAKGSDAEEGVSVWKALKRWKKDGGSDDAEKDLWKRIKIRMNDRGELIICV